MTVHSTVVPAGRASRLPLLALSIGSFGIGTTEFVIMGLLPDVARDLDVTIPQAGLLVTSYALSVTFASPLLAIATAGMNRKRALLLLAAVFILGNLACAMATGYWVLMAARVLTALCHGAFFGLGAVVAAALAPEGRKAQAIAMMFAGLTLANVLGVPFGTALGEAMGWRTTFYAVAGIGVAAAAALALWLPQHMPVPPMHLGMEARALGSPQVVLAMLISILASASLFSVFTYIAPILQQVTGLTPHEVTFMLLLFGAGLTAGNFLGGWLADRALMPAMLGLLVAIVPVLVAFAYASAAPAPAAIILFIWGALAFALVAPLQLRVVKEAARAPNLASTLNQGAFNFGNATGAWIGGLAITYGTAYERLPFIGVGLTLSALALALLSWRLERRGHKAW